MWSQVDLRKHHYKQSYWRWWNFSWAISNPERWCCESAALNMPANLENSAVATGLEKIIPIPKKGNAKECSNYCTFVLISHSSKVMLKILQARPQRYMNHELPDVQAGFRKGRGTRQWHPAPVLLPGKPHGQRSLVGCSPRGREESDTTEWLHFHFKSPWLLHP